MNFIIFLVSLFFCGASYLVNATPLEKSGSWIRLNRDFKESLHIDSKRRIIEFCPDNTCDMFVAKKNISDTSIGDFIYLYFYFFSDFYSLKEWREQKEVEEHVKLILNNSKYDQCNSAIAMEKARCIELNLSQGNQIRLYSIRYDEQNKRVQRKNIYKEVNRKWNIEAKPIN